MQLGVVVGVFALIFVAELPDKTMIATLIMGSRNRPLLVWIGVTAAFGVHVTIAVLAGGLLALLPHAWVEGVTALLFAGGAVYLLVVSEEEEEEEGEEEVAEAAKYHDPWAVWVGAFVALVAVGALGAFGGKALLRVLPLPVIRKAGGVLLAAFAGYTLVVLIRG